MQPPNPNFNQQNINMNNPPNSNIQQQYHVPNIQQIPSNSSLQQQFPNQNMQQMPSNSSYQKQFSNQNLQQIPSNSSFQYQFTNPKVQHMPSNSSIQQPQQSQNSTFSQLPVAERPFQGFPVIYDNFTFIVDPVSLCKSSQKFKELIDPYINNYTQMNEIHLLVLCNQFTKRNMQNFLRICQNLPTDVQNSEMKEICEIAKMFKADEIYNKGLAFIVANQDPNFSIPDRKYDGSDGKTYLAIEGEANLVQHDSDIDDAYFEDANNSTYQGNYYKISTNSQTNEEDQNDNPNLNKQQDPNLDNHQMLHDPESNLNKAVCNSNNNNIQTQNTEDDEEQEKEKEHSAVYQVRFENHTFKCPIFKFVQDHQIIYTAKQKYNEVFIGEGAEVHIRNHKSHVCYMLQNETTKTNNIRIGDNTFEVRYVGSGNVNHYSIQLQFPFNGKTYSWSPKPPRYNPQTDRYYLSFHGEYHHTPILSSKNIVLQNQNKHATFIVRKMDQNVYEIECSPKLDPLYAFAIGLSDIIGPYLDPWSNEGVDLL